MKVKILCEIEADIVDKEELESMENNIQRGARAVRGVENLWKKIIEEKLKDICPYPVYDNTVLRTKVDYLKDNEEIQEFKLGDTAYMIDEDYRFFESEVYRIELRNGKYLYETGDGEFEYKDIGDWVFTSAMYREIHLENMI